MIANILFWYVVATIAVTVTYGVVFDNTKSKYNNPFYVLLTFILFWPYFVVRGFVVAVAQGWKELHPGGTSIWVFIPPVVAMVVLFCLWGVNG